MWLDNSNFPNDGMIEWWNFVNDRLSLEDRMLKHYLEDNIQMCVEGAMDR